MMDVLSLDTLLNLPRDILKISDEYEDYSGLVSESIIKKYYHSNLKRELNNYFIRFKDIKYSYQFPISYYKRAVLNPSKETDFKNQLSDPVGNLVSYSMDEKIWLENFYHHILNLSAKLTKQEAVYLVDSFFAHRSEEIISDKLGICRSTLQKIKKSCLVKMWLELQYMD